MLEIPEECQWSYDIECNEKATHYVIVEDNEQGGIEFYCEPHAKRIGTGGQVIEEGEKC